MSNGLFYTPRTAEQAMDYERTPMSPRDFEILLALEAGPLHGYGIIGTIAQVTEGRMNLATSTLYATLRRLLAGELVEELAEVPEASSGPPRRYYGLTRLGRTALREEAVRISELAARTTGVLAKLR